MVAAIGSKITMDGTCYDTGHQSYIFAFMILNQQYINDYKIDHLNSHSS